MTVVQSHVDVGASPTPIATVPGNTTNNRAGRFLLINNTASASVFLGGADVATSGVHRGLEWKSTHPPLSIDLEPGETLYGIVASVTQTVDSIVSGRPA